MEKPVRQLIQKGDPRLNIALPKSIKKFLADSAKLNKRSLQDELIKRLAASFKHSNTTEALKKVFADEVRAAYQNHSTQFPNKKSG